MIVLVLGQELEDAGGIVFDYVLNIPQPVVRTQDMFDLRKLLLWPELYQFIIRFD